MSKKKFRGFGTKTTGLIVFALCLGLEVCGYFLKTKQNKYGFENRQLWAIYNNNYGNLETDGKWVKWNTFTFRRETERFDPPNFIPSIYQPYLGLYSSNDRGTIGKHFEMLEYAKIDGIIVPFKEKTEDARKGIKNKTSKFVNLDNLEFRDSIDDIFQAASRCKVKVGIIINAFNMDSNKINSVIRNYLKKYRLHSSLLKYNNKPVVFFNNLGNFTYQISIKNKIFSIIYSEKRNFLPSLEIADGFAQKEIIFNVSDYETARSRNFKVIPIVSPGYNESARYVYGLSTAISREGGRTYDKSWEEAFNWGDDIVLIDSFNKFSYGTEIEPVSISESDYATWGPPDPFFYLKKTAFWSTNFHTAPTM